MGEDGVVQQENQASKKRTKPHKRDQERHGHADTTAIVNRQEEEELNDTIFIRNVSRFETTAESLKEYIEENFGETVYCLICKDRETGESKGTAFVKFKSAETAARCLEEFEDRELQTKFFLDGRNLFVLPALSRDKIGEVKRAVAVRDGEPTEDGPKKFKKPRHNRAKPISSSSGDVSAEPQAATPSLKEKPQKPAHQFHNKKDKNHTEQKGQKRGRRPGSQRRPPGGTGKVKKSPGGKAKRELAKKGNKVKRGRHTR